MYTLRVDSNGRVGKDGLTIETAIVDGTQVVNCLMYRFRGLTDRLKRFQYVMLG